jgi:hypothetical protein
MENLQFRQALLDISIDIGQDDLEKLKFLLKDVTESAKLKCVFSTNMQKDMVFANPNNPVVILRFAHPAIVPIEGVVLFELGICTISGHFIIIF